MPALHIRNLPEDVHQGLKALAASHGRSTEAEVRNILSSAVKPMRMGAALWELGRQIGLTNNEAHEIENGRDRTPAEPVSFEQ